MLNSEIQKDRQMERNYMFLPFLGSSCFSDKKVCQRFQAARNIRRLNAASELPFVGVKESCLPFRHIRYSARPYQAVYLDSKPSIVEICNNVWCAFARARGIGSEELGKVVHYCVDRSRLTIASSTTYLKYNYS